MKKHLNTLEAALTWWHDDLTRYQRRNYEIQTYGYGDEFEDNSLIEDDVVFMYKKYVINNKNKQTEKND